MGAPNLPNSGERVRDLKASYTDKCGTAIGGWIILVGRTTQQIYE